MRRSFRSHIDRRSFRLAPSRMPMIACCCAAIFLLADLPTALADEQYNELQLATFVADISPPLHQRVDVGFIREFTEIEHPLLAKGVVLRDRAGTYVLCALDLEGLCNDSYDEFRRRIAEAAETIPSRVAVQSLHLHTAPVFDANTDRLLYADDRQLLEQGRKAEDDVIRRIADAVRESRAHFQHVTHLTAVTQKVDRVASNRRIEHPDGSIVVRYSAAATDPMLRDAPEGLIDPDLRTITFYDGERPLVRLHYYATHPQTRSNGIVTYDAPGMARERLQQSTNVFQIYFTGCGGNIAMGKYNTGSDADRAVLSDRMYQALEKACRKADRADRIDVAPIEWLTTEVDFPIRQDDEFALDAQRDIYRDMTLAFGTRLRSAMYVAWVERLQVRRAVEFSSLAIGSVRIVHLPGEPFVQFQLQAQKARPDQFVAVAGYGECAPWYIGEDRIYTDRGGYEQTWSFVGPCEKLMHETIARLLK